MSEKDDAVAERVAAETRDDGGPAFPEPGRHGGMSVRTWLAGQALAGPSLVKVMDYGLGYGGKEAPEDLAREAVRLADETIAALKR